MPEGAVQTYRRQLEAGELGHCRAEGYSGKLMRRRRSWEWGSERPDGDSIAGEKGSSRFSRTWKRQDWLSLGN